MWLQVLAAQTCVGSLVAPTGMGGAVQREA